MRLIEEEEAPMELINNEDDFCSYGKRRCGDEK